MAKADPAPNETAAFVRRVLIVFSIAALFFIAWHLRTLLVMVFGSVVVATVFRAVAGPIERHTRLPDRAAVGAAILIILGLVGGLVWLFGSEIARQVQTLSETLPTAIQSLLSMLASWGLAEEIKAWVATAGGGGGGILASVGRFVLSLSTGIADTLVVIFGGIFLALQPGLYRVGAI